MRAEVITGDCLETMRSMPASSIDLVITSPPYNLGEGMERKGGLRVGHSGSRWPSSSLRQGYGAFDDAMPYPAYVAWQKEVLRECWRLIKRTGAIYYNHKERVVKGSLRSPLALIPDLPVRQIIIWSRGSGFNFSTTFYVPTHELIILLAKPDFQLTSKGASGVGSVWGFPPEANDQHPAPFPIELPKRILETARGQVVLDPFCGRGTTGEACVFKDRDFTGIELDPHFAELSRANIKRAQGRPFDIPKRSTPERDYPLLAGL